MGAAAAVGAACRRLPPPAAKRCAGLPCPAAQGLWVGRRVPEVDENGAPILYSRYTSIEDVMQVHALLNATARAGEKGRMAATDDGAVV